MVGKGSISFLVSHLTREARTAYLTNGDFDASLAENLNSRLGDLIQSQRAESKIEECGAGIKILCPIHPRIGYHTKARAQQKGLGTGDLLDHCDL